MVHTVMIDLTLTSYFWIRRGPVCDEQCFYSLPCFFAPFHGTTSTNLCKWLRGWFPMIGRRSPSNWPEDHDSSSLAGRGFRGFFLWGLKKKTGFLRRSQSKHLHWRAFHHAIELVVQSCWSLRATAYRSAICFDQTWQAMARLIARKGVIGQQKLFLFFIMFANGLGIASSNCTQYQWSHAKVLSVRRYQQW